MNHAQGLINGMGRGISMEFEEFRIMTRTTFGGVFKGRIPTEEDMRRTGLLSGHDTVDELIEEMDANHYGIIVACATKMWSPHYHHQLIMDCDFEDLAKVVLASNGRLLGAISYNPFRIEESLFDLERAVREFDFRYVWFHPLSFGLPPNDRRFYPLYAKCNELKVPVGLQVGHSAEVLPSDGGRPMLMDEVAIDFPNLRINLSHTGWPWVDEWCSMLWRHPNVYGDISAYFPSSLDDNLVRFMDSGRGRRKVMFGTNGLGLARCISELNELDIRDDTKQRVLRDNAIEFLRLEE
jgi:predicted TIM-barrel fold metal-dependent hydrolase